MGKIINNVEAIMKDKLLEHEDVYVVDDDVAESEETEDSQEDNEEMVEFLTQRICVDKIIEKLLQGDSLYPSVNKAFSIMEEEEGGGVLERLLIKVAKYLGIKVMFANGKKNKRYAWFYKDDDNFPSDNARLKARQKYVDEIVDAFDEYKISSIMKSQGRNPFNLKFDTTIKELKDKFFICSYPFEDAMGESSRRSKAFIKMALEVREPLINFMNEFFNKFGYKVTMFDTTGRNKRDVDAFYIKVVLEKDRDTTEEEEDNFYQELERFGSDRSIATQIRALTDKYTYIRLSDIRSWPISDRSASKDGMSEVIFKYMFDINDFEEFNKGKKDKEEL